MKKVIITAVLSALVFTYVGYLVGLSNAPKCHRPHINVINDGRFTVVPADTVEGRQTYNVLFEDETGLDSMYPEEIAKSLVTGRWQYNEDLIVTERAY